MQKVLDHGYLSYVEHWGSDERIIEAARMSTGKGFRMWEPYWECQECMQGWHPTALDACGASAVCDGCGSSTQWKHIVKGDLGLLTYLNSNLHSGPFEFAGCIIEVQAPIFVFREWHRHRAHGTFRRVHRGPAGPRRDDPPAHRLCRGRRRLPVCARSLHHTGCSRGGDSRRPEAGERAGQQ